MKNLVIVFVMLFLAVSCTEQRFGDDFADKTAAFEHSSEFASLIEKARWGDGQAYLQLADCYRDGRGVKQDFLGMLAMIDKAEEYGVNTDIENYLNSLPEGSDSRLIYDAVENCENKNIDEVVSILEQLSAKGFPDGYVVQGVLMVERGDTLEGLRLIKQGADAGSLLGKMMQCIPKWQERVEPHFDIQKLTELSDKIPYVNIILAKIYAGFRGEHLKNESLAAHYLLKADENACLGKGEARWLLDYHKTGQLQLSNQDIQRLRILAGDAKGEEVIQASCRSETLEASVDSVLKEAMTEYRCTKGMVYVVETAKGAIRAQVSIASNGKEFVPCEDSYHAEQSTLLAGPTYLALLSSGKISEHDIIDTGCGIYKDVRDHNWRRGGYGILTLSQALVNCSHVAFAKAKEAVFGNNTAQLDNKISEYLADMPNDAMGILTFYNAIANGGQIVKLVTEGDEVIVLNELIAESKHIRALQQGLYHAATYGLFRRVTCSYAPVAACGRTFPTEGKDYRMELCGYFPADHPLYTIMVILEKEGLPASADSMCGSVMSNTIDVLTDSYNLRPMSMREYAEPEEVVEAYDTVVVE